MAIMELLQAWILFPAALTATSVSLGLAVFALSGIDLKSPLVLPAGLVALVLLGSLFTLSSRSSPITSYVVLAITIICTFRYWHSITYWYKCNSKILALGLGVFYLHGLPIIFSRTPTFAGWIKLDDGATWLALTDQILRAGRLTSDLAPSTHEAITQYLLNPSQGALPYPTGSFVTLGIFSKWLLIDPAWIMQPFMAAAAMALFFGLTALLTPINIPAWSKSLAAFIGPVSALYLGYAMWGGIKEVLFVPVFMFVVAMVPEILSNNKNLRSFIPLVLGILACIAIFGPYGAIWTVMPITFLAASALKSELSFGKNTLIRLGVLAVLTLAAVAIVRDNTKFLQKFLSFAPSNSDIGNLIGPLKFTQIFGVWLNGDFRYSPQFPVLNALLIILAGLIFTIGLFFLHIKGHSYVALLAIWVTLLSAFSLSGNAWISGKTLAIASPIVTAVLFCAIGFLATKFAIMSGILVLTLSGGILCSYAYTYHEVWLAPYDQLKELENIGKNEEYRSPALMLEFSPYGARHFLRQLDAEGASEFRRNLIPLKDGSALGKQEFADIDEFSLDAIQNYETLVLRAAANSSRPPSNYDLKISGQYYEVWKKNSDSKPPINHFSFGGPKMPNSIPDCSFIESMSLLPQFSENRILVSSGQAFTKLEIIDKTDLARDFGGNKVFESKFEIFESSKFDLWVEGWIKGRAQIFLDDKLVVVPTHVLNQSGTMALIEGFQMESGSHVLKVITDSPWLIPGSGGISYPMGPFYLSDKNKKNSVEAVQPANLKALCTQPVDWIELVPR